ncbi:MAG: hypothetical protein WCW13_03175 [archaeon]|jgi:hypothetical protein
MVIDYREEALKILRSPNEHITYELAIKQYPKDLPLEDKLKGAVMTNQLYEHFAKNPKKRKLGKFFYALSGLRHPECPIQFTIWSPDKQERLATVGFYVQAEGDNIKLVINNIQGIKNKQNQLELLSTQLGENWRVAIAKKIKRIAGIKKVQVAGALPAIQGFLVPGSSPEGYRRQLRQYRQTFRKAGITTVLTHNVTPYPAYARDIWTRVKLKQNAKPPK